MKAGIRKLVQASAMVPLLAGGAQDNGGLEYQGRLQELSATRSLN
ncbi:hypothetical protein CSC26_7081 (plasmid) [Pseudomonas aeruginosa]|nr:hypothetical protein CSC26_7081 [Pseudomonas aeruginosa]